MKSFDLYEQARVKDLTEYEGDLSVRKIHNLDEAPQEGEVRYKVGYKVHNLAHDLQKEMPQLPFSRKVGVPCTYITQTRHSLAGGSAMAITIIWVARKSTFSEHPALPTIDTPLTLISITWLCLRT